MKAARQSVPDIIRHIEHAEADTMLALGRRPVSVGDFLRVGNDAIQPLEKSASKLLICNERNLGACGLQDFDAGEAGRIRARRERNGAFERATGTESRSPQVPSETPANTQDSAMKKANRERLAFRNWWRGAESNRSPQVLVYQGMVNF